MCEPANVPRIGEDSYKNVKNFAISVGPSTSREIPGQARNEAKKAYSLLYTFTVYLS